MIAITRYVRGARGRAVLVVVSLVVALIASVVPSAPAEASGGRAAILFPFGGKTWLAGEGPGQHHHFWNAWATDLHAAVGTPVQARFASSDGNITLSVASVSPTCAAPNNAGHNVTVNVYVNGGFVGEVIYGHLNNVQVGTGLIAQGATLGYLNNWAWSSCWQDNTSDGVVHTHIEVEKGCYRNVAAWTDYPASTPLGLLNAAYPNNNVSACDENEVTQVITGTSGGVGTRLISDVNGDSRADAVVMFRDSGTAMVAPATGGGAFASPGAWSFGHSVNADRYMLGDVNADQKADLVAFFTSSGTWRVSISTGTGFLAPTDWASGHGPDTTRQWVADATGDGKADAITFDAANGDWRVSSSSGSGFWPPELWRTGHGIGSSDQLVADFNGDERVDAAAYVASSGSWYVGLSTTSSFGYPGQWSAGHGMSSNRRLAGDSTGDGRADAAYFFLDVGHVDLGSSSGSGFWAPSPWAHGHGPNTTEQWLPDTNADGRTDFVTFDVVNGDWRVSLSSGTGFWSPTLWIHGHGAGS